MVINDIKSFSRTILSSSLPLHYRIFFALSLIMFSPLIILFYAIARKMVRKSVERELKKLIL